MAFSLALHFAMNPQVPRVRTNLLLYWLLPFSARCEFQGAGFLKMRRDSEPDEPAAAAQQEAYFSMGIGSQVSR